MKQSRGLHPVQDNERSFTAATAALDPELAMPVLLQTGRRAGDNLQRREYPNMRYAYLDEFAVESEHVLGLKYRVGNNF